MMRDPVRIVLESVPVEVVHIPPVADLDKRNVEIWCKGQRLFDLSGKKIKQYWMRHEDLFQFVFVDNGFGMKGQLNFSSLGDFST